MVVPEKRRTRCGKPGPSPSDESPTVDPVLPNGNSPTGPGFHQLRPCPRQLSPGRVDVALLRRAALADSAAGVGAGTRGIRHSAPATGRIARNPRGAAAARGLLAPHREFPAAGGSRHRHVPCLPARGLSRAADGLSCAGHCRVAGRKRWSSRRRQWPGLWPGRVHLRGRTHAARPARDRHVHDRRVHVRLGRMGRAADQSGRFLGNPPGGPAGRRRHGDPDAQPRQSTARTLFVGRRGRDDRRRGTRGRSPPATAMPAPQSRFTEWRTAIRAASHGAAMA